LGLLFMLTLSGCGEHEQQTSSVSSSAPATPQTSAATSASAPAVSAEAGKKLFQQTCAACHGMEGQGMPNLGKDMTTSPFIKQHSNDALLVFIKQGRMPGDPANTTGVAMPPKGGNPALTDDQLRAIIVYMRTLEKP
jgi:disulfide bond formation protein DsbB